MKAPSMKVINVLTTLSLGDFKRPIYITQRSNEKVTKEGDIKHKIPFIRFYTPRKS